MRLLPVKLHNYTVNSAPLARLGTRVDTFSRLRRRTKASRWAGASASIRGNSDRTASTAVVSHAPVSGLRHHDTKRSIAGFQHSRTLCSCAMQEERDFSGMARSSAHGQPHARLLQRKEEMTTPVYKKDSCSKLLLAALKLQAVARLSGKHHACGTIPARYQ